MEIKESQIADVIKKLKEKELKGINVTLPFKRSVIPFLTKTINDAADTHSVNTIFLDDNNELIGENTDVFGFQAGYLKTLTNQEKKNKKALVIGAGGVSPSIILALIKSEIKEIYLTNRTYERSLFLKQKFSRLNILKWENFENIFETVDIVINATSLGLKKDDNFNIKFEKYNKDLVYIDTIYNPPQTNMVKQFKSKQLTTYNGLNMFIYQGQKSFYLWNKINPEVDDELLKILESKIN
jgi:shikimate dehydrogenase